MMGAWEYSKVSGMYFCMDEGKSGWAHSNMKEVDTDCCIASPSKEVALGDGYNIPIGYNIITPPVKTASG